MRLCQSKLLGTGTAARGTHTTHEVVLAARVTLLWAPTDTHMHMCHRCEIQYCGQNIHKTCTSALELAYSTPQTQVAWPTVARNAAPQTTISVVDKSRITP